MGASQLDENAIFKRVKKKDKMTLLQEEKLIDHLKKLYETAHELRCHLIESGVHESLLPPPTPPPVPPGSENP